MLHKMGRMLQEWRSRGPWERVLAFCSPARIRHTVMYKWCIRQQGRMTINQLGAWIIIGSLLFTSFWEFCVEFLPSGMGWNLLGWRFFRLYADKIRHRTCSQTSITEKVKGHDVFALRPSQPFWVQSTFQYYFLN